MGEPAVLPSRRAGAAWLGNRADRAPSAPFHAGCALRCAGHAGQGHGGLIQNLTAPLEQITKLFDGQAGISGDTAHGECVDRIIARDLGQG